MSSFWLQGQGDPAQIEGAELQGSRLGEGGKFWNVTGIAGGGLETKAVLVNGVQVLEQGLKTVYG